MKNKGKVFKIEYILYECVVDLIKLSHFVYPSGKPMSPHLLRCQGLAVDDYSLTSAELSRGPPLDALTERSGDPASGEAGATSTFAQLGFSFYY
jgi:hypothetical protein